MGKSSPWFKKIALLCSMQQKTLGHWTEQEALYYLQTRNLSLLARNFQGRCGEIDLVMRDRDQQELVFVEVRSRCLSDTQEGHAEQTVTPAKRRRLIRTAAYYLQKHYSDEQIPCRFDVVGVYWEKPRRLRDVVWLDAAFTL